MQKPMKITTIGSSGFYAFDLYRRVFSDEKMRPVELRIWNRNPETGNCIAEMLDYARTQSGINVDFNLFENRKKALRGTDYVLFTSCIDYPRTRMQDMEVCEKFEIYPLEGETMSPGGLMNAFRHIPLIMDVARDLEEVSPDAVIIPTVNPLLRLCDALNRHTKIRFIGHCDGIIHTKSDLAAAIKRDPKDVEVIAAGINHLTFILRMWDKKTRENLLPYIEKAMPNIRQLGPFGFRFSNMVYRLIRYYPSPGDNHIADQLPFVSRKMQFSIPIPSLDIIFPPKNIVASGMASNINSAIDCAKRIKDPQVLKAFLNPTRTEETGTWMEAMHGRIPTYHFEAINIPNNGHISNLPKSSIVEIPGDIDVNGARGFAIGDLPLEIASLCQRMLVAHESAVEACIFHSREAAIRSLAFEPTVHDLSVIEDLLDALLDINEKYLSKEFIADMRRKNNYKAVSLIEPVPDNKLRPDAPAPENPPTLDILTGAYWGADMGNLSDKD
ncbi:MAG: family 4 glycosyl hydrolase [Candidatus Humimicrobiaceae bacterium]